MSTPTKKVDKFIQWPLYHEVVTIASFSSSSRPHHKDKGESIICSEYPRAPSAPTPRLVVDHTSTFNHSANSSVSTPQKNFVARLFPKTSESGPTRRTKMGKSEEGVAGGLDGGIFSRLSAKFLAGRGSKADTKKQSSELDGSFKRFSLQQHEPVCGNRERIGASGLRRSWLFDKRMMPIVPTGEEFILQK